MSAEEREGVRRRETSTGLCSACVWAGKREPDAPTLMSRDAFLEELEHAIDGGTRDLDRLAAWVGISRDGLTHNLRRAAREGDERAIRIRSKLPVRKRAL